MKRLWKDCRGEGYVRTAVIIIASIVVGALILGGVYFLFGGEHGVVNRMSDGIDEMMSMDGSVSFRLLATDGGKKVLQYSYDGDRWFDSLTPTYGEDAVLVAEVDNGSEENLIRAAYVREGTDYHILTSTDGGISWNEKLTISGITEVTHFYYGTSDALPRESGRYQGEKFVFRYKKGNYYTMVSDGVTWNMPTWSDMIMP